MGSYLGVDIGEKRIGIALCDTSAPFPAPLTTLEASPNLAQEFATLLRKHNVQAVIVGYPRNQNGEATAQTTRVKHIVKLLQIPKTVQIYWQDESLTSHKAEEELNRRKKPYVKADIDALAATFILEDFVRTQPPRLHSTNHSQVAPRVEHITKSQKKTIKNGKKHRVNKKKRSLVLAGVILLLTVAFCIVAASTWYFRSIAAKSDTPHFQVVTVQPGSGTQVIATALHEKGLIKSPAAFTLYVRLNKVSNLQAGSYRISSNQSVAEIVSVIAGGKITTVDVLIAPGLRLDQVIEALEDAGYSQADIRQALLAVRDHPLLKKLPANTRLEGYLFPDTYKIGPDTSVETLIRLMLNNFQQKITPQLSEGIKRQGLTIEEAVILASIVQKEEPNPAIQKTIAQVFITRYKTGMPLGADPTFKYAAAQFGDLNSPESNSPYNTRRFVGLPPSAIANFNISALEAVANPSTTSYIYFVHGDDGKAHFSTTLEEHQANTQKYCTIACR